MTPVRIKVGINKAEDGGGWMAEIGFYDALRRAFPTTVSRVSRVSWLDPPGDLVRPKFSNI